MSQPPTTVPSPHIAAPEASAPNGGPPRQSKPKLKKLRLLLILVGLSVLAMVSTVFGMMMAVASDLPKLENKAEFRAAENSVVYSEPTSKGAAPEELAQLTGNNNRILVEGTEISPNIKHAVIAIEDQRFYDHDGVDYKGITRALYQDVLARSAKQGGSTITQQFVKNALTAQNDRSVFQKLREAALAYHLERQWTKEKVLTQYLNSVYFGNGAYGVEAAVRTYFGQDNAAALDLDSEGEADLDANFAIDASPAEAALLAGMIASPSLYDPLQNPKRATERRNQVLQRMLEQELITEPEYDDALTEEIPTEGDVDPPEPDSREPYFTSWLTQQLVDLYNAPAVFSGGLEVQTTLDPELQFAAEQAVAGRLGSIGPSASLVAIQNNTGEVKAMVGGSDFSSAPFNLATNGHRQPGSAFKAFTLVRALEDGVSPDATFASQQKFLPVPGSKTDTFEVNNYEGSYAGVASLRSATARSDNSVFAELGLDVGTKRIAKLANAMGVRTDISTNPAMTLGGLTEGVTTLEMAQAYSTIANRGVRVSGTLASSPGGPVAIESVEGGGRDVENKKLKERVFSKQTGETAQELLSGVVAGGTGAAAEIGEFAAGKTGTTENYGDAWFVGFNSELTVAVWVGYADKVQPMQTEYAGGPVAGGTYPAQIWGDLMRQWIAIRERRDFEDGVDNEPGETGAEETQVEPLEPLPETGDPVEPESPPRDSQEPAPAPAPAPAPQQPAPAPAPPPTPAPQPAPTPAPPSGGGGTGGGEAAPR